MSSSPEIKLLVVDDEDSVLSLITFLFRSNGYQVLTAKTGREAVEMIQVKEPDLVVLDYMMPEMDGLNVLRWIKKNHLDVGVLMVTGKGDERVAVEVMKAGADDYVLKPFQGTVLISKVEHILSKKKKNRKAEKHQKKVESYAEIGKIASGCNEDVQYNGEMYHIQTEDLGLRQSVVASTVFHKGVILTRKAVDYSRVAGEKDFRLKVSALIRKLHKHLKDKLLDGQLTDRQ